MIRTYLDLSTSHLQVGTMRMLTELSIEQRAEAGWPAMTVANYRQGAFVTVPEKNSETMEQLGKLPDDLAYVLDCARSYGITVLRFDSDAPAFHDFAIYDW